MSQIISSNLLWQQEQTAQSFSAATLSIVPGRLSGFIPNEHYLLDETGCLLVVEGVIQWGLSVGLHHTDTHYVKKLHPSDLSHTSVRETNVTHVLCWMFKDRTLRRGCYIPVCHADLIHELYRKSVPVVQRWMLRVKRSWCQRSVSERCCPLLALYWTHSACCNSGFL